MKAEPLPSEITSRAWNKIMKTGETCETSKMFKTCEKSTMVKTCLIRKMVKTC